MRNKSKCVFLIIVALYNKNQSIIFTKYSFLNNEKDNILSENNEYTSIALFIVTIAKM